MPHVSKITMDRTTASKRPAGLSRNQYPQITPISLPTTSSILNRKPACPCGGSCPKCQSEQIIQAKLKIGEPNDKYEQEADHVADQVMRMSEPKLQRQGMPEEEAEEVEEVEEIIQEKPLLSAITPLVQRQTMEKNEEDEDLVQAKNRRNTSPEITPSISTGIKSLQGTGHPLSVGERSYFEPRFGRDFSQVRLHTDGGAAKTAQVMNARAFTFGHDVVFGPGQYAPESLDSKRLLAHELTHTIQQGHVANVNDVTRVQRDEFEPWPGQIGHDVAGTREHEGDIIREQVQRIGDPTYTQLGPMLLEFNSRTCALTVRKELNFVNTGTGDQSLSDEQFLELRTRILRISNEQLNGWVSIHVAQSDQCTLPCNGSEISVNVVTTEGAGSYSSTINLHRTFGRENAGNIGADASERTIWHEVGHVVLGAADEYSESSRPDSTARPSSRVNESDWSIMSGEGNTRRAIMHARHFSHLTAWLGRRFSNCTFEIVEESRPIVVEFSPVLLMGGFGTFQGDGGLYYSAGLDLGIPLDRLRRLELILGARFNYMAQLSPEVHQSLLLGFRAGIEGQFGSSGVRLGGFAEGGGVGFTDLATGELGTRGYAEGGLNFGYSFGGSFNIGLEAAAGGRELDIPAVGSSAETEFLPYYRLGLMLGGNF